MPRYFLGSRASVHLMVVLEDKYHNKSHSSSSLLLDFLSEQRPYVMEYGFCPMGQLSWLCLLPRSSSPFHPSGEEGMLERQHWCCGSTTQQYPKHWCVSNTFLDTSAWHRDMRGTVEKINSISDRTNTHIQILKRKRKENDF